MGRDKVLGLSLAILVIGIAAAFCFRNEQFVENGLKLARANVLDEAISKLPGPKPYVQEAKREKPKASLPTVTLNGIESVDPFAERQASAKAEPDKKAQPIDTPKASPPVKLAAAEKKTAAPIEMPAIDTKPAADPATASIDTDRAAPEINTSKPSAAAPFPAEKPSNDASTLLTSTAPPIADQSKGDDSQNVGEIVIRPNAPAREPAQTIKDENASWQPKAAKEKPDTIADNSPRIEPNTDDSTGDDPHRTDCSRSNLTRDIPSVAPPKSEATGENSTRDTPVAIDTQRDDRSAASPPPGETPAPQTDSSSKSIMHRVRRGDMLTKIALHYLGDSRRYREIFEANRDQLRTPNDRLKIGMILRIPANTAPPIHRQASASKRKSRSGRSNRSLVGTAGASKVPVHHASRVHEKPQNNSEEQPPVTTPDDQGMNSDNSSANRFVPVHRAPFLPGTKGRSDQGASGEKSETMEPATSLRDVPRPNPITLAGDREDATIR